MDERATHYWDGERILGRYVSESLGSDGGTAAWDVFLVYGPEATWGDRPEAAGSPVISETGRLERVLRPYRRDLRAQQASP